MQERRSANAPGRPCCELVVANPSSSAVQPITHPPAGAASPAHTWPAAAPLAARWRRPADRGWKRPAPACKVGYGGRMSHNSAGNALQHSLQLFLCGGCRPIRTPFHQLPLPHLCTCPPLRSCRPSSGRPACTAAITAGRGGAAHSTMCGWQHQLGWPAAGAAVHLSTISSFFSAPGC